MAARIVRFTSRPDRLRLDETSALRQLALSLEDRAPVAVRHLLSVLDAHTTAVQGWSFVMISPEQNKLVFRWIREHARRPWVSLTLWNEFFCHMVADTGEIVMTRRQMMQAAGTSTSHVSDALTELAHMGALIRRQEGREVRWFMNPRVGTRLANKAREDAQSAAPQLTLV